MWPGGGGALRLSGVIGIGSRYLVKVWGKLAGVLNDKQYHNGDWRGFVLGSV